MSANAVITEAVFLALIETLEARRAKVKIPNVLMRELQGIHRNTTMNDLNPDFRSDIRAVGQLVASYINKSGYKIVPKDS